jgi:hypothetical protein
MTKLTTVVDQSPSEKRKAIEKVPNEIFGRWLPTCPFNIVISTQTGRESAISVTHYWVKYDLHRPTRTHTVLFSRYRDFSKSFNRWVPASEVDASLIEKFDKAFPEAEYPTAFRIMDMQRPWIIALDDPNECESSEDDGAEEDEWGFEPRKRRKPIPQYFVLPPQ